MATLETRWTIEQLSQLPDDGNRYELVRGELFVTPVPRAGHEIILARLHEILAPYVRANNLGLVLHRAVVRVDGSQVQPDLTVQQVQSIAVADWDTAPIPSLVVEVLSDVTRRRDLGAKRELYLSAGVPEYWIVDQDAKSIRVVKSGVADVVVTRELEWQPVGAVETLVFDVAVLFA